MNQREAADFIYSVRPLIMQIIKEAKVGISGGSIVAGNYLPRDGSLPMAGDLNMGAYSITNVNLVDGVDLSSADPFPQYLRQIEADALYVPLTRQVIAGTGLTDGGALSSDITINAAVANTGATGLTVEADAIRLTSSSNPGAAAAVLASDSSGRLQLVKIGLGVAASYPLHVQDATGVQARIAYDASNYADIFVDSGGNMKLTPVGHLIASTSTLRPALAYTTDLGSRNQPFFAAWITELRAERLSILENVVTLGGLFTVGAGGYLVEDCPSSV